mmetsp:Transcript_15894/g.40522  ORF Transcript_15894/g.40522 Transcript_15894/m.40522 type:complete len:293 (-) Transcript_15894:159-1037(-)
MHESGLLVPRAGGMGATTKPEVNGRIRMTMLGPKVVPTLVLKAEPATSVVIVNGVGSGMDKVAVPPLLVVGGGGKMAAVTGGKNGLIFALCAKVLDVLYVALAVCALNARAVARVEHPVVGVRTLSSFFCAEVACPRPDSYVRLGIPFALGSPRVVVEERLLIEIVVVPTPRVGGFGVIIGHWPVLKWRARHLLPGVIPAAAAAAPIVVRVLVGASVAVVALSGGVLALGRPLSHPHHRLVSISGGQDDGEGEGSPEDQGADAGPLRVLRGGHRCRSSSVLVVDGRRASREF